MDSKSKHQIKQELAYSKYSSVHSIIRVGSKKNYNIIDC